MEKNNTEFVLDAYKRIILSKKLNVSYSEAIKIYNNYCYYIDKYNLKNIENELYLILIALKNVMECDDIEELKSVNTDLNEFTIYNMIPLEDIIKSLYAKEYNDSIYSIKNQKESLQSQLNLGIIDSDGAGYELEMKIKEKQYMISFNI